jgi:uncharacterized protein
LAPEALMTIKSLSLQQVTLDKNLLKIKNLLLKEFSPTKMYLFGSRANGQFRNDSDYDIAIIVPNRIGTRLENMQKARLLLFEQELLGDVFVYTEQEFNDWKNELSSIPQVASTEGVEIPLGN